MANATHNGHQTNGRVTIDDEPENPLHRLTPEQIEALGRELDELHQEVKDSLGDRDARYIRSIIALQRRLALLGRVELFASRWRIPWVVAPRPSAWPRSSRTWRSATTSCTDSGIG